MYLLQPSKTKFKKMRKGRIHGNATRGTRVSFGSYGLKALEPCRITSRQIESARRAISHHIKKYGKIWVRIFPHTPVTKRPPETRMGKGKGSVEFWVAKVKPGFIMFEIEGGDEQLVKKAFTSGSAKLPIKTKIVRRIL